tara:strand:- start:12 stop:203 length:192 start_codon:yes stop_codon:yes gene_type:complete
LSNKKLTNAELGQIVETQKETLGLIQMRISQLADQLSLIQSNIDRFKVDVARDVKFLADRINT